MNGLKSGSRISLAPNDATSTPRHVSGYLAYYTDESYFLMLGRAARACEFPKLAWHVVEDDEAASMALIEKSLYRKVVEAAKAQGKAFELVPEPGRLLYKIDGKIMTPGEAADLLGVSQ